MILKLFQGFCMALADSVPGVSGGTVAFILGFYERFISALHSLFGKDSDARRSAFRYLLKIGMGWAIGLTVSILLLARLFESHIYFLSSLFLGLTLASIPFIVKEEKKSLVGHYQNLPFLLAGFLIVCGLTAFRVSSVSSGAVNYLSLQPLQAVYLFFSGALAMMAMVLPGVSGSTLLLIMGVYIPTVNAVHAFLYGNLAVLPGLIALGIGVLTGVAASVHFLRSALRKHRSRMMYLILGLMLGSLAAIVMGPTTLPTPRPALSLATFQPLGFAVGIAVLLALELLKKWASGKEALEQQAFIKPEINLKES
nr:DUF368 domain-containing protein [uncultured Oscillibacter sp.]